MSNTRRRPGRLPSTPSRLSKALAHPVRVETLRILAERPASASEIAEELQVPVSNVTYHVRRLQRFGCVAEVEASPALDAAEHRYRAVQRPVVWTDEWRDLPQGPREAVVGAWMRAVGDDLRTADHDGTLDARDDRHLSRTRLRLDEQAFAELGERLDEVLDWALGAQAESAVRLANDEQGGAEVDARMILAQFGRTAG